MTLKPQLPSIDGEVSDLLRRVGILEAIIPTTGPPGAYTRFIPTLTATITDPTGFTIDSYYWESIGATGAQLLAWWGVMIGDPGPGVFDPGSGTWQITTPPGSPSNAELVGNARFIASSGGGFKAFQLIPAIGSNRLEFLFVDAYPLGVQTLLDGSGVPWTDPGWPGLDGNILTWNVIYPAT